MTDGLDLSIVVPAFNAELTIERALRSTFPLLDAGAECIVVNDGSVDSTVQVVTALQQVHPGIRLVSQLNTGLSEARNRGIAEATSGWLTFLDADDEVVSEGIIQALLAAGDMEVAIGKSQIQQVSIDGMSSDGANPRGLDEASQRAELRTIASWLLEAWGGLLGCVFSRDLLDRLEPAFAPVAFGEDLVFTFNLSLREREFASVNAVGYRYSVGGTSQMTAPASRLRLSICDAFEMCEDLANASTTRSKVLLWLLIERYRWSPARHVSSAHRKAYRIYLREYASGLRVRLGLRRLDIARGAAFSVIEALKINKNRWINRPRRYATS